MGVLTVTGAKCICSFGSSPCTLAVTSQLTCMADGKPIATIQDMQPGANLATFGMCSSLANPAVASATAAALGVLTPQPCTMVPAGTWTPTNPKVMAKGIRWSAASGRERSGSWIPARQKPWCREQQADNERKTMERSYAQWHSIFHLEYM